MASCKKTLTLEQKRDAVLEDERTSIRAVALKYKVDKQNIRQWKRKLPAINEKIRTKSGGGKKRCLDGGGRKPLAQAVEDELYQWYKEEYEVRKNAVSRNRLIRKAKEIQDQIGDVATVAFTKGWLDRFLDRHHIVQRRTTTVCQAPPRDYVEKLVKFIVYVREVRKENGYNSAEILGCDETAVWVDPTSSTTLAPKGAKDVPVSSTGHSKLRITVLLTGAANGFKYRPYVLVNRKRPIQDVNKRFANQLVISWAGRTWMDDSLTREYLRKIIGAQVFTRKLLIWDSFRCHISDSTKKELKALKIDTAVIPGGCTKFIQPADVSWNKPFKGKIQEYHCSIVDSRYR